MIMRDGKPYLERFYLFKTSRLTVMIHKFWASDPDEPHDHPWNWASLVLRGCYKEHSVDGTSIYRMPGSFIWRRAGEFHRVEVEDYWAKPTADGPGGFTTTLFCTGRRRREWGFLRGDKWLPASEYDRQEVEIQGRDFVIEGIFFPRVRYLKPKHTRYDMDLNCWVPVNVQAEKETDVLTDWTEKFADAFEKEITDTDGKFAIATLIEVVDYIAKLEMRINELEANVDVLNVEGWADEDWA
jgi:hypothetical protein